MESNRISFVANLLTIGNAACGFAAIATVCRMAPAGPEGGLGAEGLAALSAAGWLVLLGMVFDVFDGRVARMAGGPSALGAQLDSLSDLVTFGVAPALVILRAGGAALPSVVWWQRAVWLFSLAYALGALMRLARFTAEDAGSESEHTAFRGLPTPAAAGCVVSLVIFHHYAFGVKAENLRFLSEPALAAVRQWASHSPFALPLLGLVLGFAMVSSRIAYAHVGSWLLGRRHSFDTLVYVIFAGLILWTAPEAVLPVLFLGYLVYAPVRDAVGYVRSAWRARERSISARPRKGADSWAEP